MDEETQKHIFEPFFTTKEQGKGVGMGLSAVYGTIKSYKGAIKVYSKSGSGSTFKIYLPLASHTAKNKKQKAIKMEKPVCTAHILLIDDEEVVCAVASAMLTHSGYGVTVARDVAFALCEYKKNWQHIDLVILDMIMPKMTGKDVFLKLKEINPRVMVLLSSGYSITHATQQVLDLGASSFIQKPFHKADLLHKINEILH